ncbi:cuticle protein CP14.6-like [Anopheles bellator]|uniref:cuticle protein CP14.6-like n=1 Tax=Anopheles bellator TaxID=139047 RepID=UPI0026488B56|nr:cuticle protein CP14.6-like [Anopheles bellator]
MFRQLFAVVLVVAIVAADRRSPRGGGGDDATAETLSEDFVVNPDGSYTYNYETSNGISASQASSDGTSVNGNFAYTSPEGERIEIVYVADENGFQPRGAHLPTEPPAPDHVIKMLEDLLASPPDGTDIQSLEETLNRLRATQG